MAGMERGLSIADMRKMQLGQIVDFCIAYNERVKKAEKQEKNNTRKATQADIKAFFG